MIKLEFKAINVEYNLVDYILSDHDKFPKHDIDNNVNEIYKRKQFNTTSNYFICEDIYAISIIYDNNKPYTIFYSVKNSEEKCGIKVYLIYCDKCEFIKLNDELIVSNSEEEVIKKQISEDIKKTIEEYEEYEKDHKKNDK